MNEVPEVRTMEGIQFVIDDRGEKTAVLIDLKVHGRLWEEFYNGLIACSKDSRTIRLGGIWKGVKITDEDVRETREELLKKLEEKW
jgi:hypothetical protein